MSVKDYLDILRDTPLPTILVIGGIIFLLLSIMQKAGSSIETKPGKEKFATLTGIILLLTGIALYLVPPSSPSEATTELIQQETQGIDSSTAISPTSAPVSVAEQITIGKCPNTSEEAANLFGGTSPYWKRLNENSWKFGPAPGAPIQNLIIPEGMSGDWWDNYKSYSKLGEAEVGYASEATIYCVP